MKKKTILLTGASSGIGKQIYETIRSSFLCVTLQRRKIDDPHAFTCDLGDEKNVENVLDTVRNSYHIDMILLNAGIYLPDSDVADLKKVHQINFMTNVMILEKFMDQAEKIILVSSIAAKDIRACNSLSYGSSKIAMEYYCRCLRERLRATGQRVIIISPGAIQTPIFPDSLLKKYGDQMMKVEDFSDLVVNILHNESTVIQEDIVCLPMAGILDFKE
jgi:short-subunit dehydrogenase